MNDQANEMFQSIHAVLHLLGRYCDYCYYNPTARATLPTHKNEHKGKAFFLTLLDDGNLEVKVEKTGTSIIYSTQIVATVPNPSTSLDNLDSRVRIVNKDHIPVSELEWAEEVSDFAASFFQRTAAFIFFARMHPTTLNQLSGQLVSMASSLIAQQEKGDEPKDTTPQVTA